MRTIKFRAKRADNGEWETGGVAPIWVGTSREAWYIVDKVTGYHTPVIPDTVGQFTGLLDKNGNEIYEGDILLMDCFKTDLGKYTKKMVVSYKIEDANDGTQWSLFTLTDVEDNSERAFLRSKNMTVIGSVHDNPELLEGGKE